MSSNGQYLGVLKSYRANKKKTLDKMLSEGYRYGSVLHFDNMKGLGVAVDEEGTRFVLHHKNLNRIKYKILSTNQRLHFRPGTYKTARTAEDVAIA